MSRYHYCPLSGQSMYPSDQLDYIISRCLNFIESCTPPISFVRVREALETIANHEEDITYMLVDLFSKDGTRSRMLFHYNIPRILDSQIRVVSSDIDFVDYFGFWAESVDRTRYKLNYPTSILVSNTSFAILSLATGGRMTLERIWRIMMHEMLEPGSSKIILECRLECPDCVIFYPSDIPTTANVAKMNELECLGDVELIQQAIMRESRLWAWMRPDRFPPGETPDDHLRTPTVLEPGPILLRTPPKAEHLPLEILIDIASYCSLSSLLCLLSTSRNIRSKVLADSSDRDALARAWVRRSAPWYMPEEQLRNGKKVRERVGWAYLVRCISSPSMRSRKRIWDIAEQLERDADAMGI